MSSFWKHNNRLPQCLWDKYPPSLFSCIIFPVHSKLLFVVAISDNNLQTECTVSQEKSPMVTVLSWWQCCHAVIENWQSSQTQRCNVTWMWHKKIESRILDFLQTVNMKPKVQISLKCASDKNREEASVYVRLYTILFFAHAWQAAMARLICVMARHLKYTAEGACSYSQWW